MKASRLPVLLLALLMAVPAAADMRGVPASDGHPQATIEGTITHVGIPFASPGPIVSLLGGLVSFDAEGARVRHGNGREATTADLAAGQRILAILDPESPSPKATSVVILSDRAGVVLTGEVEAVDPSARTLKLLGLVVAVNDRTVFGGPWDGAGHRGLESIAVGDLVLVEARAEGDALVAGKVMKLAPAPETVKRLHGTVGTVGTDAWTIQLADGKTVTVKIGPETKFVGDPKVGDEVDVLARKQSDGSLLAILISRFAPPPVVETERYSGILRELTRTSCVVGPKVGDGPDRLFAVNEKTRITGDPKVGDEVGVLAEKQADGTWLAVVVARVAPSGPGRNDVEFEGTVRRIDAATMMGAFWLVDETRVFVSPATEVRGRPAVGDRVRVEGVRMPDATVLAKSVEKL